MNAIHREMNLYSGDGLQLFAQSWVPETTRRAELLIVHGYKEHGGRYRELAHTLADAGIASTALDLRGHGRSEGTRGFVRHFEDYHADVRAALATLGPGPRFLLGHSLGGLIVIDFVARHAEARSLNGLVVVSPYLGLAIEVPPVKRWVGHALGGLFPKLSVPSGLDPAGLSHDQVIVDAYRNDPMVFPQATAGWFQESTLAQERAIRIKNLEVPILVYYSETDPIASGARSKAFAETLVSPDKTVRPRAGALHEILNETDRQEVHAELRDWILSHLAPRPGAPAKRKVAAQPQPESAG
jgi:acylglycerol lipase